MLWQVGAAIRQTKGKVKHFVLTEDDLREIGAAIGTWATESFQPDDNYLPNGHGTQRDAVEGIAEITSEYQLPVETMEKVWKRVAELGVEGGGLGFSLFAGLARAFPDRVSELQLRLRRGLVTDDDDIASMAGHGLYRWVRSAQDEPTTPEVAIDLIQEVATAIATRRKVTLAVALEFARWLFSEGPTVYRETIIGGCDHGLGYLRTELSYEQDTRVVITHPLLMRRTLAARSAFKQGR